MSTPGEAIAAGPGAAADVGSTIDELEGHCFGCGPRNPQGLHLTFTVDAVFADNGEAASITARSSFSLTRVHEGAPGYVHGGIIATLIDEVMSKLNRPLGVLAMTRHMEVDYLRPAPVGAQLVLTGRHLRREGRKLFHEAELTAEDGTVLARAKGLFVVVNPAALRQVSPVEQD